MKYLRLKALFKLKINYLFNHGTLIMLFLFFIIKYTLCKNASYSVVLLYIEINFLLSNLLSSYLSNISKKKVRLIFCSAKMSAACDPIRCVIYKRIRQKDNSVKTSGISTIAVHATMSFVRSDTFFILSLIAFLPQNSTLCL